MLASNSLEFNVLGPRIVGQSLLFEIAHFLSDSKYLGLLFLRLTGPAVMAVFKTHPAAWMNLMYRMPPGCSPVFHLFFTFTRFTGRLSSGKRECSLFSPLYVALLFIYSIQWMSIRFKGCLFTSGKMVQAVRL